MVSSKKAVDIKEYETAEGKSPFGRWFKNLDHIAAAKIVAAVEKISNENFSNVKALGGGVSEYKLRWGPGYRIYFGQDGQTLVILLGGGVKKGQSEDIEGAKVAWVDYKKRKREEQKAADEKARNKEKLKWR
jgi:putative addiction module killer protein